MPKFLLTWIVSAIALAATAYAVPGFTIQSPAAAFIAALILGLVNAILRPILIILTFPLTFVTFGLFLFVINAITLSIAAALTPGFDVNGFVPALISSVVLVVVTTLLNLLFKNKE
jgi:putative membrane protein